MDLDILVFVRIDGHYYIPRPDEIIWTLHSLHAILNLAMYQISSDLKVFYFPSTKIILRQKISRQTK